MNIKQSNFKQIQISNHALHRAKQRISIDDAKSDSLIFEMKLKEIIQMAEFRNSNGCDHEYELVYNNHKYKIIGFLKIDNCLLIKTIVGKN